MSFDPAPLSKTAKYKKITKPLLERKRRARINRCLDELKDLMVGALEIDDDNLSKLEKADILELTVNHLTKLHSPKDPVIEAKKFQAGFGQCAAEACQFIMSVPDLDANVSQNLISHLSHLVTAQPLTIQVPDRPPFSPPISPSSVVSDRQHYYSDHDRSSSDAEDSVYSGEGASRQWARAKPMQPLKQSSPPGGLLTTVDKLPSTYYTENVNYPVNGHRNNAYYNRVPAEAKDAILQKIRQHIMDKRGNENIREPKPNNISPVEYYNREEHFRQEYRHQYPSPVPGNGTLDLRKVRSPIKIESDLPPSPERTTKPQNINESNVKISPPPIHREEPTDYSNLPPKKKRKLIEYQEYKKQEEAKRQMEAFYAERNDNLKNGPPSEDIEDKWRPW